MAVLACIQASVCVLEGCCACGYETQSAAVTQLPGCSAGPEAKMLALVEFQQAQQ